tara:strand:- start:337 stop:594 length:258 start_codon:yes stop_codon:yes gene_type:complete
MNRKKRINEILKKDFIDFTISIHDNSHLHIGHNNFDGKEETHILVKLKPKNDKNFNRLEIHRLINHLLKNEFLNGLHSLEIKIIN